jgi:hypothetical protein
LRKEVIRGSNLHIANLRMQLLPTFCHRPVRAPGRRVVEATVPARSKGTRR